MQSTDIIQPTALGSAIAINGDKTIPNQTASGTETSSISAGFLPITSEPLDDGGVAPERTDFNGMFYLSTDQRFYLQNGGLITYSDAVATKIGGYPQGAILGYLDANGNLCYVKSLIDNNQNNFITTPANIDGTKWEYVTLKSDLSNLGSTSSNNFDGQWVNSPMTLSTATSVGTHYIDLSTYLPDDNFTYELDIYAYMVNTTYQSTELSFGDNRYTPDSPYYNDYYYRPIMVGDAYYTNYDQPNTTNLLYVTKNRTLRFSIGNHSCSSLELKVYRYRRLGTNS